MSIVPEKSEEVHKAQSSPSSSVCQTLTDKSGTMVVSTHNALEAEYLAIARTIAESPHRYQKVLVDWARDSLAGPDRGG